MNLGEFSRVLKQHGYFPDFIAGKNNLAYKKLWIKDGVEIPIQIVFENSKPTNFPICIIESWKSNSVLQEKLGIINISPSGRLCYIDASSIWWDSSRAVEFTLAAIERIDSILSKKLQQTLDASTFYNDFIAYWNSDAKEVFCLSDFEEGAEYLMSRNGDMHFIHHSDTVSPGNVIRRNINYISLPMVPIPETYQRWPPKSLSDFVLWLQADRKIFDVWSKKVSFLIKNMHDKKGKIKALEIATIITFPNFIESPNNTNNILVLYTISPQTIEACLAGRNKSLNILFRMEKYSKLNKYSISKADSDYIYSRNSTSKSILLKNKRIAVIGAGTIGGFLMNQLADSGAGSGPRGELTVIDHDVLKPGNLSRHILGFSSLNDFKAMALASHLREKNYLSNIKGIPDKFENIISDFNYDIVINATGMQTVGVNLELLYKKPVLHCWIEGNGYAARCFLNKRGEGACFRCLWDINSNGQTQCTHPILKDNSLRITPAACHESYIPYDSIPSILAATLAYKAVCNFFLNNDVKTLTSTIVNNEMCLDEYLDVSPIKNGICELCS